MKKYSNKKYSQFVYACQVCWRSLAIGKKPEYPVGCCRIRQEPRFLIVFDSVEEHRRGFELKILEQAGKIQELTHHEKFKLAPRIYYYHDENPYFKWMPIDENKSIEIPHQYGHYESDFSFIQDGKKRVIEVKDITKKTTTVHLMDPVTEEKLKTKTKIPWPFFATQDPLSHFKKKCKLMKAIYGVDVEIWAGNKMFIFDEKWRLKGVIK